MGKIVEIKNFSFSYGEQKILENFSFSLQEGTICTILSPSGGGKSTLARVLVGLEEAHAYIKVFDLFFNPKNMLEIKKQIGIIFESSENEFYTDKVINEFYFPLKRLQKNDQEINKEIDVIVHLFSIEHLLSRSISTLSCCEKQLVKIAAVLLEHPRLLILDEALSLFDQKTKNKVWKILKKLKKQYPMTILHFTHDTEECLRGKEVAFLSGGQIILHEELGVVLQQEKYFTQNQLSLPFIADLSNKLRYYKVISKIETNPEKLVDLIWK